MTFFVDDVMRARVNVSKLSNTDYFYVGDPIPQGFQCNVPKSMFQNEFHWFYLYSNGQYEQIGTESKFEFMQCNKSYFILMQLF